MSKRTSEQTFSRRQLLASAATTTAVAATTGAAAAQDNTTDGTATDETATNETAGGESGGESVEYDFDGYLDDARLYDGPDSVEDLRGQSSVTVNVGAGSTGLAFGPPAIHIDPGTTVTWEWTGNGGAHNVVANDGTFESGQTQTSGTFDYTFEEDATHTYYCNPHQGAGMKGAVVVGSGGSGGGESDSAPETAANDLALQTLAAMLVLGLLSPIIFLLFVRRKMQGPPRPE